MRLFPASLIILCSLLSACNRKDSSPVPKAELKPPSTQPSPGPVPTDKPKSNAGSIHDQAWTFIDPAQSQALWTYRNGQEADHCTILESLGGGIGVIDFDNDGRPDFSATGGGQFGTGDSITGLPTALFQNLGSWQFIDRGLASRLAPPAFYTHGVAAADFNNDGFDDLAITGYRGLMLWTGMGDGTFIEVARSSGIEHSYWSSSAAWFDIDNDHDLDLYVADYVDWSFANHPQCRSADGRPDICPPKSFSGLPHGLYISQGDGTFATADATAGLMADGKGLGVVIADLDADGWSDIYVANDTTNNFLYLNHQGKLDEQGEPAGVALDDRGLPNGSMGVDVMDYNRDGKLDLWVCNYEDETFGLYRNVDGQHFVHSSRTTGLNSIDQRFVGFGTACVDFDGDGDEDVVVANGHVIKFPNRSPRKQLPLFLSNEKARFIRRNFSSSHYLGQPHEGRGLATADFDGDGDLDLVISHCNEPIALLRNEAALARQRSIELVGTQSTRDAIGALVTLTTDKGKLVRTVKGGGSYLSTSQRLIHFGWPESEQPQSLTIRWSSGRETTHKLSESPVPMTILEAM